MASVHRGLLMLTVLLGPLAGWADTVKIAPADGIEAIQRAFSKGKADREVVLAPGVYQILSPIIMRFDHQTLRGAGKDTILHLTNGANCPVIIVGPPLDTSDTISHGQSVSNLVIDGNRAKQTNETWVKLPNGSPLNNSGIVVMNADDTRIEHVVCESCRSGGLVTAVRASRLRVMDLTALDSQYDGIACCETWDSVFTQLNLHDNLGAGLSFDQHFRSNVIENANIASNDVGIFMRHSHGNVFTNVTISRSKHDGVFMAQAGTRPNSECASNAFNHLVVLDCGGRAFRANDRSCTNNSVTGGKFSGNAQDLVSADAPDDVFVKNLQIEDAPPAATNLLVTPASNSPSAPTATKKEGPSH